MNLLIRFERITCWRLHHATNLYNLRHVWFLVPAHPCSRRNVGKQTTESTTRAPLALQAAIATLLFSMSFPLQAFADEPSAESTFHSVSLYWNPDGADQSAMVNVRFREVGTETWRDGISMPYNDTGYEGERAVYRSSLVHLTPDTEYEAELTLEGSSETGTVTIRTWSETFPEGEVTRPSPSDGAVVIRESGTPDAYRVYDGGGQTFDLDRASRHNIEVRANYVILRNFVLRGATSDAVHIFENHHIVIENCDISDWGSLRLYGGFSHDELTLGVNGVWGHTDAGVRTQTPGAHHIVVQRNRIHNPRYRSNNWEEPNCRTSSNRDGCNPHPYGPVAVYLDHTLGSTVVRYNEIFAGADHYFGDVIGGSSSSESGGNGYGPDSDIYGNYIANGWDDGLEIESGVRNVRIWGNYIHQTYQPIANAPITIGPLYIFRNVIGSAEREPGGSAGAFVKMGTTNDGEDDQGRSQMRGYTYIFHNTLTNPDNHGSAGPGLTRRPMRHVVTRNNVLFVRSNLSSSMGISSHHLNVDFDYDLYNRPVVDGSEANGISGEPSFEVGMFNGTTFEADYRLQAGSPGHDAGEQVPNFSDRFVGAGPDMGAHEGPEPLVFGVNASEDGAPPACDNGMCGADCDQPCDTSCLGSPKAISRAEFLVNGEADETFAFAPIELSAGDASAVVSLAWDATGLFLRAEVVDDDLRVAEGDEGRLWLDDGIEILIDADQSGGAFSDEDLQVIVNVSEGRFSSRTVDFEAAVIAEGTINDSNADVGYVLELAIPFAALGLTPAAHTNVSVDVVLNDRASPDDGRPEGAQVATADWAELAQHRTPDDWCVVAFAETATGADAGGDAGADVGASDAGDAGDGGNGDGPDGGADGSGCGCSTSAPSSPFTNAALALMVFALIRRRRQR